MRTKVLGALLALVSAATTAAGATGVTIIQQSDGSVKTYSGVEMREHGQTLVLRSSDRKGTLKIATGACSFTNDNDVQRCLAYDVELIQNGKTHQIKILYGTVFLNLTDTEQRLSRSSETLKPHGVLVVLKTHHGTYITSKGKLDEVTP